MRMARLPVGVPVMEVGNYHLKNDSIVSIEAEWLCKICSPKMEKSDNGTHSI